MARQEIDIGIEGNDGTGDSIRESFRKTNENFNELYAVFGEGGQIDFTSLADTPDALIPNTIPLVDPSGSLLNLVELASNSELDELATDTVTFDYSVPGKLILSTGFTKLSDDQRPILGGPLNANNNGIANVAITQTAVSDYNARFNTNISIDDLVISKGYADRRYVSSALPVRAADEPEDTSSYILTIDRYVSGNLEIVNHGFDRLVNGQEFRFEARYDDPNNLTSGETYFLRFVNDNQLAVYDSKEKAQTTDDFAAESTKLFVSGTIEDGDLHQIFDVGFDPSLEGNFLSNVVIPRKSAVRRQGDSMEGPLFLSDHPGDLAGFGTVAGEDDLQAATKFYVDNTSYSSTENLFVSVSGDDRMSGVPRSKEGTALDYAYRTIGAAARKAEELIRASTPEPGPYFQTITTDNGAQEALVTVADIDSPVYEQTRKLIELNREYVQKEVSGYINFKYPDFVYDVETCERDIGLILDALAYDINRGLNANYLTRIAGERYYASASARLAITAQLTQTLDGINFAKDIVDSILNNTLYRERSVESITVNGRRARVKTVTDHGLVDGEQVIFQNMGGMTEIEDQTAYVRVISSDVFELYEDRDLIDFFDISSYTDYTIGGKIGVVYQTRIDEFLSIKIKQTTDQPDADAAARSSIGNNFDLITNIIQNGIDAGADVIFGSTYKLVLDNGSQAFVDQGNPENTDTLPGKVIVGLRSGAQGRIVSLTNNDGTENNNDTFQLIQLNGRDFEVGEPVEYGNFVKEKQVTIFVESGVYEEDLPIRLSNNVSLKGDEFRRVIIRPKRRVSQSPWADMYFYRDLEFDDIPLLDKKHSTVSATGELGANTITVDDTSWMSENLAVRFIGDTVFGGVQKNTVYYIKTISTNSITISETEGGAEFNLSAATGTMYVVESTVSAFLNQINQVQGYFGRHYLTNPYAVENTGVKPSNPGNYNIAASVLRKNKAFIQQEVIEYINNNIAQANSTNDTGSIWFGFLYDDEKCSRDVGLIVDAIIRDLSLGGSEFTLEAQGEYFAGSVAGQEAQTVDAIQYISTLTSQLLVDTAPTFTGTIEPDTSEGVAETGTVSLVGNLIDLVLFAFDADYNPPKRNDADGVDVFMMSDATIVRNATVQGHGGFMVVLDPEGQILTKSPYIQTGSSFSKSDNVKRFRGGMYVDAFVGNIPARITNVVNPFVLDLESDTGQGLFIRPPELPAPFYLEGTRYQVNAIANYDSAQGTVRIFLDAGSNADSSGAGQGYLGSAPQEIFLQTAGNRSMLGNDFTQINDLGYGLVTNNGAFSEMVSMFTYYTQAAYYAKNGSEIRSLNGSNGYGNFGLVAEGADPNEIPDQVTLANPMAIPCKAYTTPETPNAAEDPFITVTDLKTPPTANSVVTIDHGGSIGVLNYRISAVRNLSDQDNDGILGNSAGDILATAGTYSDAVYELNITPDTAVVDDFFESLQDTIPDGTLIEYRNSKTQIFDEVRDPTRLETRPSTAINYDESDAVTYRSLSFSTADAFGQPLQSNQILSITETEYDFVTLVVDTTALSTVDPDDGAKTLGSQQGDTKIAIEAIENPSVITRLLRDVDGKQPDEAGYSGGMIFTYKGRTHQVIDYVDDGDIYIEFSDVADTNITSYAGDGLTIGISEEREIYAGLPENATAEITVAISLLRATGHDFTQIGTGGFNDSNYPNVILGDPENSLAESYTDSPDATTAQVWERRKGRVFFVSTDQFGFFRVGKFFSVDQATGDIEFAGEIGLTGANALGFTRGVTINEFSADDSFADISGQAVPTERAVAGYINRVLGYSPKAFSQVDPAPTGNRIGPGFLPLNGDSAMEGDIDMGANQITNLALPGSDGTAATNKNYVDDIAQAYDDIGDLRNIELNSVSQNDFIVVTGLKRIVVTPVAGGVWNIGDTIGTAGGSKTGTIVDLEVKTDDILGTVNIVSYTPVSGTFAIGETLLDQPGETANATVTDGPTDEFANASEKASSVINVTVERDETGATYDLQIQDDSIVNADVNSAAAISQSKLAMQKADTFDEDDAVTGWSGTGSKTQADLGLAKFSDENFETTEGYVRIKENGIVFAEMNEISQNQVFGRTDTGTGNASAIDFADVVSLGGALADGDFTNTVVSTDTGFPGNALVQLEPGVYGVTEISEGVAQNTIARRDASGFLDAAGYKIGGSDLVTLSASTITLSTPGEATIFNAAGTESGDLVTVFPGNIDVGNTAIIAESNFQSGSSVADEGWVATDWVYTNFIEAIGERDETSTGIGIGANTGFASADDNVIGLVTNGEERIVVADSEIRLGSAATDTVTFNATVSSNILPDGNGTRNIGANGSRFDVMYANVFNGVATEAKYADLAEKYQADQNYESGTVLVFGGDEEVTVTDRKQDTRVAGVVSTDPAYLMNSELDTENTVALALQGRVPCKVLGVVQKGDILVTSAIPGYAIATDNPTVGTIVGKALENKNDDGKGVIEIVVGRT